MKRLKKVIAILIVALFTMGSVLLVSIVLYALWGGLFNCIFPWTRTRFPDYQSYDSFLMDYRCHDYFVRELPMDASEPKYYWHRESWETFTAYSITLPEGTLKTMSDERQEFFREKEEEFSTKSIIYSLPDDHCYIDDPKWCDNEIISEEELAFINEVIGNPEAKDQYYYLVVLCSDRSDTTCYDGVILNDNTHEFIEFSAEVVNPDKWHY